MRSKHEEIYDRFTAKFDPEVVGKWKMMIEEWDKDPNKPDPYAEPAVGQSVALLL